MYKKNKRNKKSKRVDMKISKFKKKIDNLINKIYADGTPEDFRYVIIEFIARAVEFEHYLDKNNYLSNGWKKELKLILEEIILIQEELEDEIKKIKY